MNINSTFQFKKVRKLQNLGNVYIWGLLSKSRSSYKYCSAHTISNCELSSVCTSGTTDFLYKVGNFCCMPYMQLSYSLKFVSVFVGETCGRSRGTCREFVVEPLRPCSLKARGISGEQLQVLGMKELSVNIDNLQVNHPFVVIGMRNTCILGADFLKSGQIVVDVANAKLSWRTGQVGLTVEATAPTVNKLSVLLESYSDVFVTDPHDSLGRTTEAEHCVDTGDSRRVKQRPYRIPVHLKGVVEKKISDMLDRGIIQPSDSPWSSHIVLAPQKDGDYRFCVDFRRVNSVTKKDAHPIPRIDDILDQLGGATYFSTLDLASGYWQVPLKEEDREKTAFSVGPNHYEFTVMPF